MQQWSGKNIASPFEPVVYAVPKITPTHSETAAAALSP